MSTIFDYLKEVTYDSIYDRPFKELDVLSLTELTYLPFGHIVPQGDTTGIQVRLSDAMDLIDRTTNFIVSNQHLQLVDELATSKRFKNIKLLNYVDEYDPDVQKQFAAMTYRLTMDVYLVVFRGTDDTLIGWKEDFHMTYMDHVPAQRRAASYLQHVMKEFPKGRFLVAGHSKGGILRPTHALIFQIIYLNGSTLSTASMLLASTRPLSKQKATSARPQTFVALSLKDPSLG